MLLTNVRKKLGDFSLSVDSLSFSKPGVYGLIGPNGSGKSTLVKIMAGLLEKDNGTIDYEGINTKEITFLSRKPYMMEDTVYNNLVYPLKLRGIEPDSGIVNTFLDKMNFSEKGRQRAKSLSGGEQQKLAFLRAVIFKPKIIIADEAMTAMDMDSIDIFENSILEEQKKENSIWIIISHQMSHIRRICNYLFFMYDGRVEMEGSVKEIFSETGNPRLKKYLRSYSG
ncbi:MAG: ABC transporter ATP-binding protein [Treponema sp.]|nr:ABC transporter ATP-binding protein [Treponema sp.]MCL2181055.1 ABC transporter ATP-binding protein [Treponema sp.]